MNSARHAAHFQSLAQQDHATRLGMWVFLGSELLLFAGLFALYAAGRIAHPAAFREGVAHAEKSIGSLNTAVLLTSSTTVALAVEALRRERRVACVALLSITLALGATFFSLKLAEYGAHFRAGIYPGGAGSFFISHGTPGLPLFWTLYFVTTGLHAAHVCVGLGVLGLSAQAVARGKLGGERGYVLENAALYWHLVDLIWIFLWPLYYLA
jgi:cytochrome c oxidase subunit 3